MLSTFHEFFGDDFAGIVLTCFDVDGFFDDCIGALAECTACFVGAGDGLWLRHVGEQVPVIWRTSDEMDGEVRFGG